MAWLNAQIIFRESQADAKRMNADNEPMEGNKNFPFIYLKLLLHLFQFAVDEDEQKILTLEPYTDLSPHDPVFINELKLSEFKQVLAKSNINSEFSGGVLWCSGGTIAIRRVILTKYRCMSSLKFRKVLGDAKKLWLLEDFKCEGY